jgi:hypothetical protein
MFDGELVPLALILQHHVSDMSLRCCKENNENQDLEEAGHGREEAKQVGRST